jgi:hypothetical protein
MKMSKLLLIGRKLPVHALIPCSETGVLCAIWLFQASATSKPLMWEPLTAVLNVGKD